MLLTRPYSVGYHHGVAVTDASLVSGGTGELKGQHGFLQGLAVGFALADAYCFVRCGSAPGLIAGSVSEDFFWIFLITVVAIYCGAVVCCCRFRRLVPLTAVLLCHQQPTSGTVWGCHET